MNMTSKVENNQKKIQETEEAATTEFNPTELEDPS